MISWLLFPFERSVLLKLIPLARVVSGNFEIGSK